MRSLACEDSEKIAMERDRIKSWGRAIFVRSSIGDERVDRASVLIIGAVPVQTIVSPFIADQFLRKLLGERTLRARKIFFLRVDQGAARLHSGKFILAYAPE